MNNTICIDTGCVFGGALTALRYPSRELVSVPAAKEGLAALDRLAEGAPLWRVHQLVFAILALESEPVDPRL